MPTNIDGGTIGNDVINTGNLSANGFAGVHAGEADPLTSQKTQWSWGSIDWEDFGSAIEDGAELAGSAGYASWLHGPSVFSSPIDEWYVIWSSHDFNDMGVSTAPDPFSKLTYQTSFSDPEGGQTASPHWLYDPANDHVKVYYHVTGDGQHTKLATIDTAGDGTTWTIQGDIISCPFNGVYDEQERSYFRAYRQASGWVGVYQGRDRQNNQPGFSVAHSQDGLDWAIERTPAFDNAHIVAQDGYDPQTYNAGGPVLAHVGGATHLLYRGPAPTPAIRAVPFTNRDTPSLSPGETIYTPPAWVTDGGITPNEVFVSGGYLYLSYSTAATSLRALGIARVPLAGVGG